MNFELETDELNERLTKLEEEIITLKAQMAAVDYLLAGKDKVMELVASTQDKMYRLSKEVTDKLKP